MCKEIAVSVLLFAAIGAVGDDARADAPPTSKSVGGKSVTAHSKIVSLGGYTFFFPDFWSQISQKEKPPLYKVNTTPTGNISFDLTIVKGRSDDLEQFLAPFREGLHGREMSDVAFEVAGIKFKGLRVLAPKEISDNPDAVVEVYGANFGGDLVGISIARMAKDPTLDKLRDLCIKIVASGLIRSAQKP
jgi:hypothetical protein